MYYLMELFMSKPRFICDKFELAIVSGWSKESISNRTSNFIHKRSLRQSALQKHLLTPLETKMEAKQEKHGLNVTIHIQQK